MILCLRMEAWCALDSFGSSQEHSWLAKLVLDSFNFTAFMWGYIVSNTIIIFLFFLGGICSANKQQYTVQLSFANCPSFVFGMYLCPSKKHLHLLLFASLYISSSSQYSSSSFCIYLPPCVFSNWVLPCLKQLV